MKHALSIVAAAALAVMTFAAPASAAKECKPRVVASGNASLTNVGAYASSLFAWRKAAGERYGAAFRPWRRANERAIKCQKGSKDGKSGWICVRSAFPCSSGVGLADIFKGKITQTLYRGDSGKQVLTLQKMLIEAGFDIKADGKFGPGTESAVIAFQKQEGLTTDGVVGPMTLERLS